MDDKVYTPQEISDNPFPASEAVSLQATTGTAGAVVTAKAVKDTPFPTKRVAVELLSTALNTKSKKILQEFQFASSGAIRVGEYVNGVSGEINITPAGITATDTAGNTTFALDGETGSATFAGTIQAGSIIAGDVIVGNNTWVISGDPDDPRIILYNNDIPEIVIGEI